MKESYLSLQFFSHPAGIPVCHHISGNIVRHYAPGPNRGILSNRHARKDYHSCADPCPAAYRNRAIHLHPLSSQACVERMRRCGNRHVWPNHDPVTDTDIRIIHQRQVEVDIDVISKVGILTPACPQWWLYHATFAYAAQKIPEKLLLPLSVGRSGLVIVIDDIIEAPLFLI